KSYADLKRKLMEFQIGDRVMLKVSPWKGVLCFGKRGKLNPRYVGPFKPLPGSRLLPGSHRCHPTVTTPPPAQHPSPPLLPPKPPSSLLFSSFLFVRIYKEIRGCLFRDRQKKKKRGDGYCSQQHRGMFVWAAEAGSQRRECLFGAVEEGSQRRGRLFGAAEEDSNVGRCLFGLP
nr:reverse transcriptase domain-containing protein [Tanacetum cinerariifolium]